MKIWFSGCLADEMNFSFSKLDREASVCRSCSQIGNVVNLQEVGWNQNQQNGSLAGIGVRRLYLPVSILRKWALFLSLVVGTQ